MTGELKTLFNHSRQSCSDIRFVNTLKLHSIMSLPNITLAGYVFLFLQVLLSFFFKYIYIYFFFLLQVPQAPCYHQLLRGILGLRGYVGSPDGYGVQRVCSADQHMALRASHVRPLELNGCVFFDGVNPPPLLHIYRQVGGVTAYFCALNFFLHNFICASISLSLPLRPGPSRLSPLLLICDSKLPNQIALQNMSGAE